MTPTAMSAAYRVAGPWRFRASKAVGRSGPPALRSCAGSGLGRVVA
jgi:hypothetical protein